MCPFKHGRKDRNTNIIRYKFPSGCVPFPPRRYQEWQQQKDTTKKRSEKHGPANGLKTTSFQFPQRISIPTSPQYGMSRGNCTLLSWCCENILGYVSSWIDPPSGFVIFTYRKGLQIHKFQNSTFYLKP